MSTYLGNMSRYSKPFTYLTCWCYFYVKALRFLQETLGKNVLREEWSSGTSYKQTKNRDIKRKRSYSILHLICLESENLDKRSTSTKITIFLFITENVRPNKIRRDSTVLVPFMSSTLISIQLQYQLSPLYLLSLLSIYTLQS